MTSMLLEAKTGAIERFRSRRQHSPYICSSLGVLGRIVTDEKAVDGLPVSQHASVHVHRGDQRSGWAYMFLYGSSTPHY